jgi:serine/threonine-protein kinase HipA
MNRPLRTVRVFADLSYFEKPQMMGLLHYQSAARGGIFSFQYAPVWLKQAEALAFDPDLSLVEGPQYPAAERESFGIFLDSSPDRWGVYSCSVERTLGRGSRKISLLLWANGIIS